MIPSGVEIYVGLEPIDQQREIELAAFTALDFQRGDLVIEQHF